MTSAPGQIVDQLYEASIAVERWPGLLHELAHLADGAGASLFSGGQRPTRWIATPEMAALIHDYVQQPHQNSRIPAGLPRSLDGFLTDLDFFTAAQMDADPFYTEFLRPRGFGWVLGTTIKAPGVDPIVFSIEKRLDSGPARAKDKALFNALRPHMARAMLLSSRINLERAQSKAQVLGTIGLPAAVIDDQGRGLILNERFQALIPGLVQDRRDRLILLNPAADKAFTEALTQLRSSKFSGSFSIAIPSAKRLPASVTHVVPVCGQANDIFSPGMALLLVTPLLPGPVPHPCLLEALFDLTPAEAQVARAVAEAQQLDELAERRGVTKETIRLQLRAVFAKTGTKRQVELARLLASAPHLST